MGLKEHLTFRRKIIMKRLLSFILVCVLACSCFMMAACNNSDKNDSTEDGVQVTDAATSAELSEAQQKEFDYIIENTKAVLPNHTRYEYKGDVEIADYNCCRFEFFSDEMYLGAVAKAYDEEVMFWDASFEGKYMYMVNDNGWYVTGNYVNAPETNGVASNVQTNVLDDGISGQYSCNLGNFYITLYEDDYAGDADGYFRATGTATVESGAEKQYSIAGEFYASEDASDEYKAVYVYENEDGDSLKFAFSDEGVVITDNGTHMGDKYNLTGEYLLNFYY